MKKVALVAGICFAGLFLWITIFWKKIKSHGGASYPAAEFWTCPTKITKLAGILEQMKNISPGPNHHNKQIELTEIDNFGYHYSFHYPNSNEYAQFILRSSSDSFFTKLLFVAVYSDIDSFTDVDNIAFYNKEINRDYNYFSNIFQIKRFEKAIIKPLNLQLKVESERSCTED